MFGGINPGQMKAMMKQMGIKQEDLNALRVIIETPEKNIVIEPANVQKIVMQGQQSWQVTGTAREESKEEGIKEEDVLLVSEKTGKSEDTARKALQEANGDIAEAIMNLSD